MRQGKVRYLGGSNYPAWEFAKALWTSDVRGFHRYEAAQPRYNILYRHIEYDLVPLCRDRDVAVVVYNPLAGGLLTGRYRKGQDVEAGTRFSLGGATRAGEVYRKRYWHPAQFDAVERLAGYFEKRGMSLATASVAWVLAQPGITCAILGASRPEQLDASLAAAEVELDEEARAACAAAWFEIPRDPDPSTATR